MANASSEWVHERTLGGHRRDFWWRVDESGGISILVIRAKTGRKQQIVRQFTRKELGRLVGFMADGEWHALAASPHNMASRAHRDGIGGFLRGPLGRSIPDAGLAVQLAAVLTRAGVWKWDGRKRAIRYRQACSDLGRLAAHYQRRQAEPGPRPPREQEAPRARRAGAKAQPPAFDLAESCRGRASALRGELHAIGGGRHPLSKGRRREGAFRDFLRRRLPRRYGIGGGEVVEPSGGISRQMDILIYDAADEAPLIDDPDSLVLAAESVYAAIEVKPLLDAVFLRDALDGVRSVKVLPRTALDRSLVPDGLGPVPDENPAPFGAILACHSIEPELLGRELRENQEGMPPSLWVDAVCILDKAVIHRYSGIPGPAGWSPACNARPTPYVVLELGDDSLLYFLALLRRDLKHKRLYPYDLASYSRGMHLPPPKLI